MTEDDNRDRGILSPADREYLRGEKEYSRQATHAREKAVRNRTRNALLDFTLLFHQFDEGNYEAVFGAIDDDREIRTAITHAIAFLFDGAAEINTVPTVSSEAPKRLSSAGWFDKFLEEAYVLALLREDFIVNEFEPPTVTGRRIEGIHVAREMAEAGEELSPRYIQLLLHSDVIETEAIQEAVRERLLEDVPPRSDDDEPDEPE